jgi:flagellar biosynthetic protein FliP
MTVRSFPCAEFATFVSRANSARAAVALIAICAVASVGGLRALVVVAGLAGGVAVVARSRNAANERSQRSELERVCSCALAPGVSVHIVACGNRRVLLGTAGTSISVIEWLPDTCDVAARAPAEPSMRAGPRAAAVLALVALLLLPASDAYSQHRESSRQRVDAGAGTDKPQTTPPPGPATDSATDSTPVPERVIGTDPNLGGLPVGSLAVLAGLALLPFALMAITSFTKISVVLSLLRHALGTPQVPSDPVLAGMALALTMYVMAPVASEAAQRFAYADATNLAGIVQGVARASEPVRQFLRRNTRDDEIALFADLPNTRGAPSADRDSFAVLAPAFVTSELRQAFVTGFLIFLPFLVVDMIVANILMSMGMVMVSPNAVSLPFKLMLFVLIDGWPLLMKGLALSYR